MDVLNDPSHAERGRDTMFFEAKQRVEEQFPDASVEAKMALIGAMLQAHATLIGARRIADEVSSSLSSISLSMEKP